MDCSIDAVICNGKELTDAEELFVKKGSKTKKTKKVVNTTTIPSGMRQRPQ